MKQFFFRRKAIVCHFLNPFLKYAQSFLIIIILLLL